MHIHSQSKETNAELKPTKTMYKHLFSFYLTDWRHKHTYKSPKKIRDFPWWPSSPPPPTVSVVAPGSDLSRGRRTLSGTPRPGALVHHTTGAAAFPVRASVDRPLAKPRAQDQDEDQNDRNSKTRAKTKKTQATTTQPRRRQRLSNSRRTKTPKARTRQRLWKVRPVRPL